MVRHVVRARHRFTASLAGSLLLWACGHTAAEPKAPANPAAGQAAAAARTMPPVAAAAPAEAVSAPERIQSPDAQSDRTSSDAHLGALMSSHFLITISARNAVMDGDLFALRAIVDPLATYIYPMQLPAGWSPKLEALQSAARRTVEARTIDHAAQGVAAMAKVCGDCHIETSGDAKLSSTLPKEHTPPSDTLAQRMDRHAWALGNLWIGLTGPSDTAWTDGATALAQSRAKMIGANTALRGDMRPELKALRAIGADALSAKTSEARAELYGRALATCAYCHTFGPEKRD